MRGGEWVGRIFVRFHGVDHGADGYDCFYCITMSMAGASMMRATYLSAMTTSCFFSSSLTF